MNRDAGRLAAAAVCLLALAGATAAQNVYRIVGKDGRVTFSDRPDTSAPSTVVNASGGATSAALASLPLELRNAATKYPVTFYASPSCGACGAARSLLQSRGIPYSERSVITPADIEALQRIAGEAALPFLTIGAQQVRGFSDVEWTQYLNAAGYPPASQLPASYRHAEAAPLAAPSTAVASPSQGNQVGAQVTSNPNNPYAPQVIQAGRRGAPPGPGSEEAEAARQARPDPANPTGIRF